LNRLRNRFQREQVEHRLHRAVAPANPTFPPSPSVGGESERREHRPIDDASIVAAELNVPYRLPLFCLPRPKDKSPMIAETAVFVLAPGIILVAPVIENDGNF
jgi:hypothetical protein